MGTVMRLLCLRVVTVEMRKVSWPSGGRGGPPGPSSEEDGVEGDTGGGWPKGSWPCSGGGMRGCGLARCGSKRKRS